MTRIPAELALTALAMPAPHPRLAAVAGECPGTTPRSEASLARETIAAPAVPDKWSARRVQEGVVTGLAGEPIGGKAGRASPATRASGIRVTCLRLPVGEGPTVLARFRD